MQFLLTNDVQIAYAQTEGYVPVTSMAQESAVYQDYLSRMGEDNDLYYDVKIQASKLLLDNVDNTFVTPVFNGSTSLRNAAGQMIENVTKAMQRKQNVNEEFMQKLFADMTSLYRLDQIGVQTEAFGPLPQEAVVLLSCLAFAWVCIGSYVLYDWLKKKKSEQNAL
jgi:multiple sugar transport system substrate-binding protein